MLHAQGWLQRLVARGMVAACVLTGLVTGAGAQDCPKGHWEEISPPLGSSNLILLEGELFTQLSVNGVMKLMKYLPGQGWQAIADIPGAGSVHRMLRWQHRLVLIGNFSSVNGVPQPSPALLDATTYQLIPIAPADQALLTVPAGGPPNSETQFSVMNGQLFRYGRWLGWPSVFMAWDGTTWRTLRTTQAMTYVGSPTWFGLFMRNGTWYAYEFVIQPGPDYTYYTRYNATTDTWDSAGQSAPSYIFPTGAGEFSIGSFSAGQATNSPSAYGFVNYRVGGTTVRGWSFTENPCSTLGSSFYSNLQKFGVVGADALVIGAFRYVSTAGSGGCSAIPIDNYARVNALTGNVTRLPRVPGDPTARPFTMLGEFNGGLLARMTTGQHLLWKPDCGCEPQPHFVGSANQLPVARRLPAIAPGWQASTFVSFGGRDSGGSDLGDTLVWSGTSWSVAPTATAPAKRADHAMAGGLYGDAVLFGGKREDGSLLDDMWRYSSLGWYQMSSSGGPSARGGHTLTAWGGNLFVFGGFCSDGLCPPTIHKYVPTSFSAEWSAVAALGPSARFAHVAGFDERRRGLVVFGGRAADNALLGDTWFFDGASWSQISGPGPSPRDYASMHWDDDLYGLRLCGGRTASGASDEQWLLTGSGWRLLPDPLPGGPRWAHASASRTDGAQIVIGGLNASGDALGDTLVTTRLPTIVSHPQSQQVSIGQTATFSALSTSTQAVYQWLRNGVEMIEGPRFMGVNTPVLTIMQVGPEDFADYSVRVSNCDGEVVSATAVLTVETCDDIDFNNNGVFPEDTDVIDLFLVLAGGECAQCNDIDFNNNQVFPEDQDVIDFFTVLAGGACGG